MHARIPGNYADLPGLNQSDAGLVRVLECFESRSHLPNLYSIDSCLVCSLLLCKDLASRDAPWNKFRVFLDGGHDGKDLMGGEPFWRLVECMLTRRHAIRHDPLLPIALGQRHVGKATQLTSADPPDRNPHRAHPTGPGLGRLCSMNVRVCQV